MENVFYNKEDLIMHLTDLASKGNYVFRGFSIQDQLLPNIIRNKVANVELELLYNFEKYANQYINVNNPIDFLSYAQHFGLSTRLLDFTYNPFIALYFALFKDKPNNATFSDDNHFYYIRFADKKDNLYFEEIPIINEGDFFTSLSMAEKCKRLFQTVEIMYDQIEEKMFLNRRTIIKALCELDRNNNNNYFAESQIESKINHRKILFIDPNQSNQRIVMQQGLFMLCYSFDKEEHKSIIENNTHLIKIHKSLREEMQVYLNTIGINAYRLMPDLSSVCEAVERQVKESRNKKSKAIVAN